MGRVVGTSLLGFEGFELSNETMRLVVIPSLGARVWELFDVKRNRQWIWHRGTVPLGGSAVGACYDDVWAGGWEELFPNDAPGSFEGRELPDHGEWWARAWQVVDARSADDSVSLSLRCRMNVVPADCEKVLRLRDDGVLSVNYTIKNLTNEACTFLFKQHLPVAIHEECELLVPGGSVSAVEHGFGTILPEGGPFRWPGPSRDDRTGADLRLVSPVESRAREFVYVTDLEDGWCGVHDRRAGATLRMRFDASVMPYLWFFLSYGGWRDCYTAVLEPCTNMPKDLTEAHSLGQAARLPPRGLFQTAVSIDFGG